MMRKTPTKDQEIAALRERVAFLEGALGELHQQHQGAIERAAKLAGEVARLRAAGQG